MVPERGDLNQSPQVGWADDANSERWSPVTWAVAVGLFSAAFYVAYRSGMEFSQASASPFWFPDSVVLCALLVVPPKRWWVFLLAPLPIRLLVMVPPSTPVWFLLVAYAIDSARALATAAALRRFLPDVLAFRSIQHLAIFGLFAVVLVPGTAAFAGAAARTGLGHDFWRAWGQWYLGNALTHVVVTPALLFWIFGWPIRWPRPGLRRSLEGVLLAAGLVLSASLAFGASAGWSAFAEPRFYLPVPFLFWAAIRFGMHGASGAVTVIAFFSVKAALEGNGPFSGQSPEDTALALQHFLLLRAVPAYVVAVLVAQGQGIERSLRESEGRFRLMADTAPVLIWMSGAERGRTFFNKFWLDFTGRALRQELGDGWSLGVHPDDLQTCRNGYVTAFDARQPFELEYRLRRRDGEYRWIVDRGLPRRSSEGEFIGYIGSAIDITDRRWAEDAHRSLAHAQRLAMMGRLTAMIAHEVRQPLAAILTNADAATRLLDLPNPPMTIIREALADIREADLRADAVVRRIHSLVRERALQLTPIDVNETIDGALRLIAQDAARLRVRVRVARGQGLPLALADGASLQQVILNLVFNALDAMDATPEAVRWIVVESRPHGSNGIEVSVRDHGAGFPVSRLPHAFDAFFTTKDDGTGLGLAIAQSIVEAHQGHISVANNDDGGATVRFTLPGVPTEHDVPEQEAVPAAARRP